MLQLFGLVVCKFDQMEGFIPVQTFPPEIFKEKNDILREIAKHSLGFGEGELDFTIFSISGVRCLSKTFDVENISARGGSELFSLVLVSEDKINLELFKPHLESFLEKIEMALKADNQQKVKEGINELYDTLLEILAAEPTGIPVQDRNYEEIQETPDIEMEPLLEPARIVLPKFVEMPIRILIFATGIALITSMLIVGINSFTVLLLVLIGVITYSYISLKQAIYTISSVILNFELGMVLTHALSLYYFNFPILPASFFNFGFPFFFIFSIIAGILVAWALPEKGLKKKLERSRSSVDEIKSVSTRSILVTTGLISITVIYYIGVNFFQILYLFLVGFIVSSFAFRRKKLIYVLAALFLLLNLIILIQYGFFLLYRITNILDFLLFEPLSIDILNPFLIIHNIVAMLSGIAISTGIFTSKKTSKFSILLLAIFVSVTIIVILAIAYIYFILIII